MEKIKIVRTFSDKISPAKRWGPYSIKKVETDNISRSD